ncbi:helix-turn-helix transcriptional regulator [Anaerovoracaceae bacterium 41-7]|uniref:helix-turn-helix domain-containing protein n=1 Tax=Emergencia sp. JLR.KK010 TaxID=3114296 RepID=UPI0030D2C9D3
MKLGEFIHNYRVENKLTMQDFANRSGLSKGYISMLEKNQHPQSRRQLTPSLETYQKIAIAANLSLDELISVLDGNEMVSLYSDTASEIGDRIKTLREQRSLSQDALANFLGTTKQTIYKYERGIITNIPSDKIELLADALHTTPEWIMGWENETDASSSPESCSITSDIVALLQSESAETQQDALELVKYFVSCDTYSKGRLLAYAQGLNHSSIDNDYAEIRQEVIKAREERKRKDREQLEDCAPVKESV